MRSATCRASASPSVAISSRGGADQFADRAGCFAAGEQGVAQTVDTLDQRDRAGIDVPELRDRRRQAAREADPELVGDPPQQVELLAERVDRGARRVEWPAQAIEIAAHRADAGGQPGEDCLAAGAGFVEARGQGAQVQVGLLDQPGAVGLLRRELQLQPFGSLDQAVEALADDPCAVLAGLIERQPRGAEPRFDAVGVPGDPCPDLVERGDTAFEDAIDRCVQGISALG